jgi:hypothetical protein
MLLAEIRLHGGADHSQVRHQIVRRVSGAVTREPGPAAVHRDTVQDRPIQGRHRVPAAAGRDEDDPPVLAEQFRVARPHAAHGLDRRFVGREHGEQPGQPPFCLLHVHDVGLVDSQLGRPFSVSSIFTPMTGPLGGAPTPVSGFTGIGLGVGGRVLATACVFELPPVSAMLRPTTPPPTTTTVIAPAITFCLVLH